MAASSTTSCANWRPNPMRAAFCVSALAFGLTACAPETEEREGGAAGFPGYELASARSAASAPQATVVDLSVEQLAAALAQRDIRLIDVRRDDEVAQGMIPGAEHIPMDDFDPAKVVSGDDREIILYCRSGNRSRIVGEKLAAHTGKPVQHLAGGFIAWSEAGKDVALPQ